MAMKLPIRIVCEKCEGTGGLVDMFNPPISYSELIMQYRFIHPNHRYTEKGRKIDMTQPCDECKGEGKRWVTPC